VATILVPQAMAYADVAGLPPSVGLVTAAVAPIAAAMFASSPYLQTGPVALAALLTFGALSPIAATYSGDYIKLAALLALIVGVFKVGIGMVRAGYVSYLLSQPVVLGFTTGAVVLIISSQLPVALDAVPEGGGVISRGWWTLIHPGAWQPEAIVLAIGTSLFMVFGRRIHILLPGVLIAVVAATVWATIVNYSGPAMGDIPGRLPELNLSLPWDRVTDLLVPGLVIALVGFAEPAAIARDYAARERILWSPDREFVSQGVANVAAGLFSGFPVSGSFSRTSINYRSGAQTRWSSAITGALVLMFLPFASVLGSLPRAVVGAVVITAVVPLIKPAAMASLWRFSPVQAMVGWGTMAATILLAPRIEQGVLVGVLAAVLIHLWRERAVSVELEVRRDGAARLTPRGVFWFGSAPDLEDSLLHLLSVYPEAERLQIDLSGLGRIDFTSASVLREITEDAVHAGLTVELLGVPDHARRILLSVWGEDAEEYGL
jgi:SulP family sulfate permease